ncbi:MAG: class C sortase [Clostridia bacterium]|nr:class C sortase [Clostridia bacterium]
MKNKLFYVILVVIFLAGLSLVLYPTISNLYNSYLQSQSIAKYSQEIDRLEEEEVRTQLSLAREYNRALTERKNPYVLTDELSSLYNTLLSSTSQGIFAYVEIPSIDVMLPIARGTDEDVLKDKVGHLEWSSLPVGGENTHAVISAHRGLPSSELFTNIDHLELGDEFYIHILGETLKYQVCNVAIVEPDDQRLLRVEEKQDLVTLVTCTPYGINSHRLLVRGVRVGTAGGTADPELSVKNEITAVDPWILVAAILVTLSVLTFLFVLFGGKQNRKKGTKTNETRDP